MTSFCSRKSFVFAVALLVSIPAVAAQKRRAVNHPSAGAPYQTTVKGTVLDSATSTPVRQATVRFAGLAAVTDDQGKFAFTNVTARGVAAVIVTRSGYQDGRKDVNSAGTHDLTFSLAPKPTVTVRLSNGNTMNVDFEESRFGYPQVFGGYVGIDTYCKADGTQVTITPAQIKRVVGPAVAGANACCTFPAQKWRLELRSGETADVVAVAGCSGYTTDFLGRDHVTGQFVFARLADVQEIVFP